MLFNQLICVYFFVRARLLGCKLIFDGVWKPKSGSDSVPNFAASSSSSFSSSTSENTADRARARATLQAKPPRFQIQHNPVKQIALSAVQPGKIGAFPVGFVDAFETDQDEEEEGDEEEGEVHEEEEE